MAGYNTQALQTPRNTPAVTIVKNQILMHKCYIMYERSVHVSEKRLQNVVTAVCLWKLGVYISTHIPSIDQSNYALS